MVGFIFRNSRLAQDAIPAILLLTTLCASSNAMADVVSARVSALAYLIKQQSGTGAWNPAAGQGVSTTSEALTAFRNSGMNAQGPYSSGISWLANAKAQSVDSLARKIIALKQAGMDTTLQTTNFRNLLIRQDIYSWGAYSGYGASFPDTALGLAALRFSEGIYANAGPLGLYAKALKNALDCDILHSQNPDGGWAYLSKPYSSTTQALADSSSVILPAAYMLLELKELQQATNWTLITSDACGGSYNLTTSLSNGLNFIFTKRKTVDGGFGDGAVSSVIETALSYRVIKKLAPLDSRATDALNWLLSKQNIDGSWSGGAFVTALVLASFDPVTLPDADNDGVPDSVESKLGTNPIVADARYITNGNGQATPSLEVPTALANDIMLGAPFSFSLPAYGGKVPYVWTLGSGSALPPGLILNASSDVITGTPTQVGSYHFNYVVTDSAVVPASKTTPGLLTVYVTPPSMADGDINNDGRVDVADYLMAESFAFDAVAPTATQGRHADVFPAGAPDGVIDVRDVTQIRDMALGLR